MTIEELFYAATFADQLRTSLAQARARGLAAAPVTCDCRLCVASDDGRILCGRPRCRSMALSTSRRPTSVIERRAAKVGARTVAGSTVEARSSPRRTVTWQTSQRCRRAMQYVRQPVLVPEWPHRGVISEDALLPQWTELLQEAQQRRRSAPGADQYGPTTETVANLDEVTLMANAYEEALVRAGGGWAYPQTEEMRSMQRYLARYLLPFALLVWIGTLLVAHLAGAW